MRDFFMFLVTFRICSKQLLIQSVANLGKNAQH